MSKMFAIVAAAGCLTLTAQASVLRDYNLVVLGNLDSRSNVEGRSFIGGNLGGTASDYATKLNRDLFRGVYTVTVGGNITAGNVNVEAGSIIRGGSLSGNVNLNGGPGNTSDADPGTALLVPAVAAELTGVSNFLSTLPANSNVILPSGQPGAARFIASPGQNGVAVFNVPGSIFSNSNIQQIELVRNGATSIIVNVTGTHITHDRNFVGDWTSLAVRSTTLWNFNQASNITVNNRWDGAFLAPFAAVTNFNNFEGGAYVGSLTQRGEVHLPGYTGFIPAPGAMGLFAVAGLAAARRRR